MWKAIAFVKEVIVQVLWLTSSCCRTCRFDFHLSKSRPASDRDCLHIPLWVNKLVAPRARCFLPQSSLWAYDGTKWRKYRAHCYHIRLELTLTLMPLLPVIAEGVLGRANSFSGWDLNCNFVAVVVSLVAFSLFCRLWGKHQGLEKYVDKMKWPSWFSFWNALERCYRDTPI